MADDIQSILKHFEDIKKSEYQRGWDDAILHIKKSLGSGLTVSPKKEAQTVLIRETGYREGTTISKVHQIIKERPGLSGVQIYKILKSTDEDIEERTVRTSLHRLRDKWGGFIENRNGAWYPKLGVFG